MSDSPIDYKMQLGTTLNRLREQAGATLAAAAEVLDCSEGKIRTIERGTVAVSLQDLRALLDLYAVKGSDRADVEHLAAEARKRRPRTPWGSAIPDRLRRFFDVESTATRIQSYEPESIYGSAQTRRYARDILATNRELSSDQVNRLVEARMGRQARLTGPGAPRLELVMSEAALRTADADVMTEQTAALYEMSVRGIAEIRVLPFGIGFHRATGYPFTIMTTSTKTMVYVEMLTGDTHFTDDPDRVRAYQDAWGQLDKLALSQKSSLDLLDSLRAHL